jgi:hypothetical protein
VYLVKYTNDSSDTWYFAYHIYFIGSRPWPPGWLRNRGSHTARDKRNFTSLKRSNWLKPTCSFIPWITGAISPGCVNLNLHLHIVPRLRMSDDTQPLFRESSWRGQGQLQLLTLNNSLMAWPGTTSVTYTKQLMGLCYKVPWKLQFWYGSLFFNVCSKFCKVEILLKDVSSLYICITEFENVSIFVTRSIVLISVHLMEHWKLICQWELFKHGSVEK